MFTLSLGAVALAERTATADAAPAPMKERRLSELGATWTLKGRACSLVGTVISQPTVTVSQSWDSKGGSSWYDEPRLGRLAQLGERRVRNAEVVGSSPISSTILSRAYKTGPESLDGSTVRFAVARRGRNSARHISDQDLLLDNYATAAAAMMSPIALTVGVTWRDFVVGMREIGRQWDCERVSWAVTGTVAASVIAPYLTRVATGLIYVDRMTIAGLESVASMADLRAVEGGRLTLRPFPTVTSKSLAVVREDLRVAPWPRVYSDLRVVGVRGEEAAEHLRESIRNR